LVAIENHSVGRLKKKKKESESVREE